MKAMNASLVSHQTLKSNEGKCSRDCKTYSCKFPIYLSKEIFENHMKLLLIKNDYESQYVYMKGCNRFTVIKQIMKIKINGWIF